MKSEDESKPEHDSARLDAPELWADLLSPKLSGVAGRSNLERMLTLWGSEVGASTVAIYTLVTGELQLIAAVGDRALTQCLTSRESGGDSLRKLELPGSYVLVYDSEAPFDQATSNRPILLACAADILRLKDKLHEQNFSAMARGVEMMALYEVGLAISSILELEPLMEELLSRALLLLEAPRGALYQLTGDRYVLTRSRGSAVQDVDSSRIDVDALAKGELSGSELLPGARFMMGVPIGQGDRRKGLLVVGSGDDRPSGRFSGKDRRTLKLFANQAAIAIEKVSLHELAVEKKRQDRELEIAAEIQRQLLPDTMPQVPGFDVLGWTRPARVVGGDYFTFRSPGRDQLVAIIGDVSGKSSPAALLVSTIDSALRVLLDQNPLDSGLVQRLNRYVYDASTGNKYVTMILANLDATSGTMQFVNAGHNDGLLLRSDGQVERLESSGPPVGLFPAAQYTQSSIVLREGDLLCLYTDGITECENAEEEEFGDERLIQLLRDNGEQPLDRIKQVLSDAMIEFSAGQLQGDDQTVILLRRQHDTVGSSLG